MKIHDTAEVRLAKNAYEIDKALENKIRVQSYFPKQDDTPSTTSYIPQDDLELASQVMAELPSETNEQ